MPRKEPRPRLSPEAKQIFILKRNITHSELSLQGMTFQAGGLENNGVEVPEDLLKRMERSRRYIEDMQRELAELEGK